MIGDMLVVVNILHGASKSCLQEKLDMIFTVELRIGYTLRDYPYTVLSSKAYIVISKYDDCYSSSPGTSSNSAIIHE